MSIMSNKSKIKNLKQYYIFVDESGTLPDIKDNFIIIAGIGVERTKEAKNLVSRILKSLRQRKIRIKELKFYYAGEQSKRQILSGIVSASFEIFIIAIDKKNKKISDNPENFALLIGELVDEINFWKPNKKLKIIIDRHFHKKIDEKNFNNFFRKNIRENVNCDIIHINSQQNFVVNLADFVAGSTLAKYNKNNFQFYNIFKENIIFEKIVNWPALKRKSLTNKKIP